MACPALHELLISRRASARERCGRRRCRSDSWGRAISKCCAVGLA